jgi:Ca2+-binding RTX toxin-like protein
MAKRKHKLNIKETLLAVAVLAFFGLLISGQGSYKDKTSDETLPPSFNINTNKYLGSLDANNCLNLGVTYTQAEADAYDDSAFDPSERTNLKEGVSLYHSELPYTMAEVMNFIPPNENNRVFLVYYTNGNDGLDEGFHIYPSLPDGAQIEDGSTAVHSVEDAGTIAIPANTGFGIYSCIEAPLWKINSESVASTSIKDLSTAGEGWVLLPMSEDDPSTSLASYDSIIESYWSQEEDGFSFSASNMFTDLNNIELEEDYYMLWVKLTAAAATEVEEVVLEDCQGEATIYVNDDNKIVGGDHDGEEFEGVLEGTSGDDIIVGTDEGESINGGNGDDRICGKGGVDSLNGGNGDDIIYGGDGTDEITGGNNDDILFGGDGNDFITGGNDIDLLFGGAGDDIMSGGNHNDTLCGEIGDDDISGGNDDDRLDGSVGSDELNGSTGIDSCGNGETVASCEDTEADIPECDSDLEIYQDITSVEAVLTAIEALISGDASEGETDQEPATSGECVSPAVTYDECAFGACNYPQECVQVDETECYTCEVTDPGGAYDPTGAYNPVADVGACESLALCQSNTACTGPCDDSYTPGCYSCPQVDSAATYDLNLNDTLGDTMKLMDLGF